MYPLFESLCVQDGQILHAQWHRLRFEKAFQNYFKKNPTFDLLEPLEIPPKFSKGRVKLKILYNENTRKLDFQHYQMQNIQSLKEVMKLLFLLFHGQQLIFHYSSMGLD